jgi:hypothetical protein
VDPYFCGGAVPCYAHSDGIKSRRTCHRPSPALSHWSLFLSPKTPEEATDLLNPQCEGNSEIYCLVLNSLASVLSARFQADFFQILGTSKSRMCENHHLSPQLNFMGLMLGGSFLRVFCDEPSHKLFGISWFYWRPFEITCYHSS